MHRETEEFSIFSIMTDNSPNVENKIITEQVENDLQRIINELPDDQKEVLQMRIYQDLSFKEIADLTGVSINTALGRMRYALMNLRKVIDKNKIIHSGMSSHLKDGITVGGTLYLLNDKLIFQTNIINFIERHEKTIFLDQISEVDFKDTLGFIKNGLHITNRNHESDKFIVTKREMWTEKIEKQISKLN
jgi:predicted DNA-binding protein YlxM (UPF0122 family)